MEGCRPHGSYPASQPALWLIPILLMPAIQESLYALQAASASSKDRTKQWSWQGQGGCCVLFCLLTCHGWIETEHVDPFGLSPKGDIHMDSCYIIHPTHILAISTQQGKGEIWDLLEESKHVKPYNTHNNEPMTKKNIMDEARQYECLLYVNKFICVYYKYVNVYCK